MMISVGRKPDGSEKDTYQNIKDREKFIIHIASSEQAGHVTKSASVLEAGESELNLCELQTENVEGFSLPRVIGPRIAMFCRFYEEKTMGNNDQHIIFGRIEKVWLDDDIILPTDTGRLKIDASKVDPIGRLGGNEYTTFGEILDIPRPK